MDAKTLFQEGVVAIRDLKDTAKGRELLMQSLKIEPKNELAWLWLSRTMNEPYKKVQCLERALKLNPGNAQTRALINKLNTQVSSSPESIVPPKPPAAERLSTAELKAFSAYSMTPNVTADMEDMGLTPDLSAALANTTSGTKSEGKRTTGEYTALTLTSESGSGLKDLRDAVDEGDDLETAVLTTIGTQQVISPEQSEQIKKHLAQAQALLNKNKVEEAIEQWVRVLEIEVDNEAALSNAVRYLSRLKYIDDARELVWNALKAGTSHPSIYLTAIDIAKYQGADGEADELRLKLVQLPEAGEKTVMGVVEHFVEHEPNKALIALDRAIPLYPKNQKMAFRRAQLAEDLGLRKEAATYYEQAAQLGSRSKEGQLADKKLTEFMPHMSDKERGSIFLAVREAIGIGFLYLLMAFQDAGLNLALLGGTRIGGIALSIVGGYLLVTATSSPQQQPLARLFGGSIPAPKEKAAKDSKADNEVEKITGEPEEAPSQLPMMPFGVRIVLGIVGVGLLIGAFVLVFSTALALIRNPAPPEFYIPQYTPADFLGS